MSEYENGLEIDARLIAQSIKENRKSGTGVSYRPLILTLEQAYEDGEYEPPEALKGDSPEYDKYIDDGDATIQRTLKDTVLLFHLWHEIYKAASENKNQIGLDEMMEWGKAFAVQYADLMSEFENQKNYVSYYLPALKQIEELKAELAKGKGTVNSAEITARLDRLETFILSMGGKLDLMETSQQENREAESAEHAAVVKEIRHERKQHERRYSVTQEMAADIIRTIAKGMGFDYYSTCTVRTIQNWESANPKHKIPAWYPGRNCEMATFEREVKSGLQEENLERLHRETIKNIKNPLHYGSAEELDRMTHRPNYKPPRRKTDDME